MFFGLPALPHEELDDKGWILPNCEPSGRRTLSGCSWNRVWGWSQMRVAVNPTDPFVGKPRNHLFDNFLVKHKLLTDSQIHFLKVNLSIIFIVSLCFGVETWNLFACDPQESSRISWICLWQVRRQVCCGKAASYLNLVSTRFPWFARCFPKWHPNFIPYQELWHIGIPMAWWGSPDPGVQLRNLDFSNPDVRNWRGNSAVRRFHTGFDSQSSRSTAVSRVRSVGDYGSSRVSVQHTLHFPSSPGFHGVFMRSPTCSCFGRWFLTHPWRWFAALMASWDHRLIWPIDGSSYSTSHGNKEG